MKVKQKNKKICCSKLLRAAAACFMIAAVILVQQVDAAAATKSISTSFVGKKQVFTASTSKTKTISADITHDNKKDKIKIKVTSGDYGDLQKLTISVNGKKALTLNLSSVCADYITVKYIRQSKSKEYLWIDTTEDVDDTTLCRIYRYSSSTGKFKCILNPGNIYDTNYNVIRLGKVTKNKLNITYYDQPSMTGTIKWTYSYKYSDGKLKSTSASTTNVHSTLAASAADMGVAYSSYFANDQFVTKASLKLYKSPGSSKVSATIAADSVVSMDKIRIKNHRMYLYFTCGSKAGWVKVTDDWTQTDTFYSVEYLYAG